MRHTEIAQFLNGMPECVPEVEQTAYAVVKLVLLHYITLYLDTACHNRLTVKWQGVQCVVKCGIEYHSIFDYLGTAITVYFSRKGIHQCRIAAHH